MSIFPQVYVTLTLNLTLTLTLEVVVVLAVRNVYQGEHRPGGNIRVTLRRSGHLMFEEDRRKKKKLNKPGTQTLGG